MKKLLCLLFFGIILISFCTCNINSIERVSVEETEDRFNEIVFEIKKYIKDNNIILYQEPFESFEDGFGTITFAFNYGRIQFGIDIRNDRYNLFGDDYENGIEKYKIGYFRCFNYIDKVLNTDNEAFDIMPVVLSNVLGEPVSKAEIIELMNKVKNNYCNSITDNKKLIFWLIINPNLKVGLSNIRYITERLTPVIVKVYLFMEKQNRCFKVLCLVLLK